MRAVLLALAFSAAWTQDLSLDGGTVKGKQWVVYAPESQVVSAGRRATLELRFHVNEGFHINSHTPKSELLIPTRVELEQATGVKQATLEYPAGKLFSFEFDPAEKLDVYSGDFVVKLPVIASPGAHEVKGKLTYQACNHAACFPPKVLPLDILFTAK